MVGTEVCTSVNRANEPTSGRWNGGKKIGDDRRDMPIFGTTMK
jgi:hypothetical protein